MKYIFLLTSSLFLYISMSAQSRDWAWAKSDFQPDNADAFSVVRGVTTDAAGNVITTGYFYSDSLTFGTHTIYNAGTPGYTENIFTVKYDANGDVLWAEAGGGNIEDFPVGVATDADGNVYISGGFFSDSMSFDGNMLYNFGPTDTTCDGFVVKYDANGNYLWGRTFGGNYYDGSDGLTVDATGNVYVAGYYQSDSLTIGSYTLYNNAPVHDHNGLLIKYNGAGDLLWVASSQSANGGVEEYGVATDLFGHVEVVGRIAGTASFGSQTIQTQGDNDAFVTQYDTLGNALWAQEGGGTYDDIPNAIATDKAGNIYITGYFNSSLAYFNGSRIINDTSDGSSDIFVAKYNVSGVLQWVKGYGGAQNELGFDLACDTGGNVYVTGYYLSPALVLDHDTLINKDNSGATDDMYVVGLDPAGNVLTAATAGGLSYDGGYGIAADKSSNVYVGGFFRSDAITFGSTMLDNSTANHNANPFLAKYVAVITGIHTISQLPDLFLYPNPASNMLIAGSSAFVSGDAIAGIYDVTGQSVAVNYVLSAGEIKFNTQDLSPGMYLLKITANGMESQTKFVKIVAGQ